MDAQRIGASEGYVSAEELFRQHAAFVARFLFRMGVRADAIEDAVQEVFLVVHRQGGYRPGAAKPTSYLANLATHAAAAHRRRERTRASRATGAAVEDVATTRGSPVDILETNESLRLLQDALGRLDPDLRNTLVLVELEGETCSSVAAAMGIPVGTVYWRLHQARKKFQRALQMTETAVGRPREVAVQAAVFGGGLRPPRREGAGMLLLLTSSSWMDSEARGLLRLGAERPPVRYAVQEGLLRHRQLAGLGTPPPSWANGLGAGAKGAAWLAMSTAAAAGAAVIMLLGRAAGVQPSPAPQGPVAALLQVEPARAAVSSPWAPASMPPSTSVGSSVSVELLPPGAPAGPASVARPRAAALRDPGTSIVPPAGDDLLELRQVAEAERVLATDPAQALSLVRAYEARFPKGYMREERGYVEVMALLALGRLDEARPEVARFLQAYPDGAFSRRIREESRRATEP